MNSRSIASMLTDFTPKHVPADRDYGFYRSWSSKDDNADPIVDDSPNVLIDLIDYELQDQGSLQRGTGSRPGRSLGSVRGREGQA